MVILRSEGDRDKRSLENTALEMQSGYTVKPVLNVISRDQKIFPLKPGFRLIKVHYIQYKKLNQDMQTLTLR